MNEIIEIKRKEFEILEQIGENSFKVERKGQIYFLKNYKNDIKEFEKFIKNQMILKNTGIKMPKVYMWDKNAKIAIMDYVDGPTPFDILSKENIDESIYEQLFSMLYLARKAKIYLKFSPVNFKISDGKLFYLPFEYSDFKNNEEFLNKDYYLWVFSKQFVRFAHDLKVDVDESRLIKDAFLNKQMTLLAIKYYR